MKYIKIAFILFLAVSVCACSLFRKKPEAYPAGPIFPVTVTPPFSYQGEIIPPMIIDGETAYFATQSGYVYKIYVHGRRPYFETALSQQPLAAPVLIDSEIYLLCRESTIIALNDAGDVKWEITLPEQPVAQLVVVQNRLFSGTDKGSLFSIDPMDGKTEKMCQLPAPVTSLESDKNNDVYAGCSDGTIHRIGKDGRVRQIVQVPGKIMSSMAISGRRLFFSSDKGKLYGFHLSRLRVVWNIDVKSRIEAPMLTHGKYLFALSWNGILYQIHQKSGTIGWWRAIPSRSLSSMLFSNNRLIVSSMSSVILCFDVLTGEQIGYYQAESDVRSNISWVEPYLLGHVYDRKEGLGKILYLKKYVHVVLSASKASPQMVNEEIIVTATSYGFHKPEYAFFLIGDGEEVLVQMSSETNIWTWYPDKEGNYRIRVSVADEKIKLEREIKFTIKEKLLDAKEYAVYMKILKVLVKMKWILR